MIFQPQVINGGTMMEVVTGKFDFTSCRAYFYDDGLVLQKDITIGSYHIPKNQLVLISTNGTVNLDGEIEPVSAGARYYCFTPTGNFSAKD